MKNSQKGEIATLITIAFFIVIGVSALVSTVALNQGRHALTSRAAGNCMNNPPGAANPDPTQFDWIADCDSSRFLLPNIRPTRSYCQPVSPQNPNGECLQNTSDPGHVYPPTSNWCYGFSTGGSRCIQLQYKGSGGSVTPTPPPQPTQPAPTQPPPPGVSPAPANCNDAVENVYVSSNVQPSICYIQSNPNRPDLNQLGCYAGTNPNNPDTNHCTYRGPNITLNGKVYLPFSCSGVTSSMYIAGMNWQACKMSNGSYDWQKAHWWSPVSQAPLSSFLNPTGVPPTPTQEPIQPPSGGGSSGGSGGGSAAPICADEDQVTHVLGSDNLCYECGKHSTNRAYGPVDQSLCGTPRPPANSDPYAMCKACLGDPSKVWVGDTKGTDSNQCKTARSDSNCSPDASDDGKPLHFYGCDPSNQQIYLNGQTRTELDQGITDACSSGGGNPNANGSQTGRQENVCKMNPCDGSNSNVKFYSETDNSNVTHYYSSPACSADSEITRSLNTFRTSSFNGKNAAGWCDEQNRNVTFSIDIRGWQNFSQTPPSGYNPQQSTVLVKIVEAKKPYYNGIHDWRYTRLTPHDINLTQNQIANNSIPQINAQINHTVYNVPGQSEPLIPDELEYIGYFCFTHANDASHNTCYLGRIRKGPNDPILDDKTLHTIIIDFTHSEIN